MASLRQLEGNTFGGYLSLMFFSLIPTPGTHCCLWWYQRKTEAWGKPNSGPSATSSDKKNVVFRAAYLLFSLPVGFLDLYLSCS